MDIASHYWTFIRLVPSGGYREYCVSAAREFFTQQFPAYAEKDNISDREVQSSLWQMMQTENSQKRQAEGCLRCYVSHQIVLACMTLSARFGRDGNFTGNDLLGLMLDDDGYDLIRGVQKYPESNYQTMATRILQTFDPSKASLGSWTTRLVNRHNDLRKFLMENGVYLTSDWAILNDTKVSQLRRILRDFYNFSVIEIEQACQLLETYHVIYRNTKHQNKKIGSPAIKTPNIEQIKNINLFLKENFNYSIGIDEIIPHLSFIAKYIRQYRVYIRAGKVSFNKFKKSTPDLLYIQNDIQESLNNEFDENQKLKDNFLVDYQKIFIESLDRAIKAVLEMRIAKSQNIRQQQGYKSDLFLKAIYLFHQGISMRDIANELGLKAQYQVSRLVKLKAFRAEVKYYLLQLLQDRFLEQARSYDNLKTSTQIIHALEEKIDIVLMQAQSSASVSLAKDDLFAHRLCYVLEKMVPQNLLLGGVDKSSPER